jgi:hypothetical protein
VLYGDFKRRAKSKIILENNAKIDADNEANKIKINKNS